MRKSNVLTLLLFGFTALSWGQTYTSTTIAGANPVSATSVPNLVLYAPEAVHIDAAGNVYIADSGGRRIYKIDAGTNKATAIIGNGVNGNSDSYNVNAAGVNIQVPSGMATDAAGNLYFSDRAVSRIKKIDSAGKLWGMAGANVPGSGNFNNANSVPGDGYPTTPIPATPTLNPSSTNTPRGMCVDPSGNLVWADGGSSRVRKINLATGVMSTIAGNTGTPTLVAGSAVPGDGGPAVLARLNAPEDVACAADGSIYVADTGNHRIRKISANGIITTIAGKTTVIVSQAVGLDANGNPVLSTTTSSNGTLTDGVLGTSSFLNSPAGVKLDTNGNLIIADRYNNRMRALNLSTGIITTMTTGINTPGRFAIGPDGKLYVPEMGTGTIGAGTNVVRTYDPNTNQVAVFAGINHFSGDAGSQAIGALFNQPTGIAVDGTGNIYISDSGNHRVRMVDTTGAISTIIGTGVGGNNITGNANQPTTRNLGDGIPGTGTRLNNPKGVAVDKAGNVYVADTGNHRILMLKASDQTTVTVVGTTGTASSNTNLAGTDGMTRITATTYGEGQDPNVARLSSPQGVAVDASGRIYIADTGNHAIRRVDADLSTITTVAGTAPVVGASYPAGTANYAGYEGDTGPATAALLSSPTNVAVNADGTIMVISDAGNNVVRRVSGLGRLIYTIMGVAGQASGDTTANTPGYALRANQPTGVAIDSANNIWVADMNNGRVKLVNGGTLLVSYPLGQNGPSGAGSTSSTLIQATPPIGINYGAENTAAAASQGRIAAPWGIAIGPDGTTAYVVDAGNGQVRKVTINK